MPFKKIALLIRHVKFLEELQVFLPECFPLMVSFLVEDIFAYRINLGMSVRKNSVSFLPAKSIIYPSLCFYKFMTLYLNFFNKIWNEHRWLKANKKMGMIRHAMNCEHFSLSCLHKCGHVFVQFFFVFFFYETLPSSDSKDKLKIDFRIRVCHVQCYLRGSYGAVD